MPIEDELSILAVFNRANTLHPGINSINDICRLSTQSSALMAADYLESGMDFLATKGQDDYMRGIGAYAKYAACRYMMLLQYTPDIQVEIVNCGISRSVAERHKPEDVCVLLSAKGPLALIPPGFIIRARQNPLEALSSVAFICSSFASVGDFMARGIPLSSEFITLKAEATKAQLLNEGLRHHPSERSKLSTDSVQILSRYPNGLESLPTDTIGTSRMLNAANN